VEDNQWVACSDTLARHASVTANGALPLPTLERPIDETMAGANAPEAGGGEK
jgi:hypothetical protein